MHMHTLSVQYLYLMDTVYPHLTVSTLCAYYVLMANPETTQPLKYKRGQHPNTLRNLRPGNPVVDIHNNKGFSLTSALKFSLNKPLKEPAPDAPVRDQIVYATLKGAVELVPAAFRETWDRAEGKVLGENLQVNFNEVKILIVREGRKADIPLLEEGEDNEDVIE